MVPLLRGTCHKRGAGAPCHGHDAIIGYVSTRLNKTNSRVCFVFYVNFVLPPIFQDLGLSGSERNDSFLVVPNIL